MANPRTERKIFEEHFYGSLGSFINLFSIAENMLRSLMIHIAGVDEPTALALFSGVKTDQAIQNIRRLHQARKVELHAVLDRALQQMAVITGFRNDLLHHRVDFYQTPPVITNRAAVLSDKAVRETVIDSGTLARAGHDLGTIILVFGALIAGVDPNGDLSWASRQTWRHKPASQPRKRSPKTQGRPKQPRPPKSSRDK